MSWAAPAGSRHSRTSKWSQRKLDGSSSSQAGPPPSSSSYFSAPSSTSAHTAPSGEEREDGQGSRSSVSSRRRLSRRINEVLNEEGPGAKPSNIPALPTIATGGMDLRKTITRREMKQQMKPVKDLLRSKL